MATVPTPLTYTTGQVVTAAQLNGSPGATWGAFWLSGRPICQVRNTAATSLTSSAWTPLLFATEDFDNDGMHSTSSNTDRVTIQTPGTYEVSGMVSVAAAAGGSGRGGRLALNGTALAGRSFVPTVGAAADNCVAIATQEVACIVGDIIRMEGFQNSGGAVNTDVGSVEVQSFLRVAWKRS